MRAVVVRSRGQVTLSKAVRELLGVQEGNELLFVRTVEGVQVRVVHLNDLLKYLNSLNSHAIYPAAVVAERLRACGFHVALADQGRSVILEGSVLKEVRGSWGDPGIAASSLMSAVVPIVVGRENPKRFMGMGFQFDSDLEFLRDSIAGKARPTKE